MVAYIIYSKSKITFYAVKSLVVHSYDGYCMLLKLSPEPIFFYFSYSLSTTLPFPILFLYSSEADQITVMIPRVF